MKAKGHIIVDGNVVADTAQCAHCGMHFQIVRGSGTRRGWCMRCNAPTCGSQVCCKCIPFMKRIDQMEKRHAVVY